MIIFIKLILAHFIGDFLLQPTSWVKEKQVQKIKSPKFYWHILIHGVLILVLLWNLDYWLLAVLLMLTHGIIDWIKLYAQEKDTKPRWFFIDQALHLLSILILWILLFTPHINWSGFQININTWIYITVFVFITMVSGIMIQTLLANWSKEIHEDQKSSLKDAGKYIGILERLFVFIFTVTGNWVGIGFLLAAKSVFRFGDLKEAKERKLTEYVLIGTLLSFGLALLSGVVVLRIT